MPLTDMAQEQLIDLVKSIAQNTQSQDNALLELIKTLTKNVIALTEVVEKQGNRIAILEKELKFNQKSH